MVEDAHSLHEAPLPLEAGLLDFPVDYSGGVRAPESARSGHRQGDDDSSNRL